MGQNKVQFKKGLICMRLLNPKLLNKNFPEIKSQNNHSTHDEKCKIKNRYRNVQCFNYGSFSHNSKECPSKKDGQDIQDNVTLQRKVQGQ